MTELIILIPQYNDWEALSILIDKINTALGEQYLAQTSLIIVDDCSSMACEKLTKFEGKQAQVIRLYRNLGHQRAIAVGLSYIATNYTNQSVIVMDADGEDSPLNILELIDASKTNLDKIYFAQRTKRQESFLFRMFYQIYKFIFKLLTGSTISFGNFCIIPPKLLQNIVRVAEIWNNFPGGVVKSRVPYGTIPIERAKRLAGESKMNFVSLVTHGLSAISVLIESTSVRVLMLSVFASSLSLFGLVIMVLGRVMNFWYIEKWGFSLALILIVIILQTFFLSLFLVFMVLQHRTNQQSIPIAFYNDFIEKVTKI